jgi:hypothetical protein
MIAKYPNLVAYMSRSSPDDAAVASGATPVAESDAAS